MTNPHVPGPGDLRQLLVRFLWLVVLPVVGLVGFGVLAISNERAAVERRFVDEYAGRLRVLAASLARLLETGSGPLWSGATLGPTNELRFGFHLDKEGLMTSPPQGEARTAQLELLLRTLSVAPDQVSLVPVVSGPARGIYAVRRTSDGLRGLAFDEAGLAKRVEEEGRRRFPDDPARFTLAGPRVEDETQQGALRRFLDALTRPQEEADPLSLPLPPPLEEWRIAARLSEDDPVSSALLRNRIIYIAILALFYAVITLGVVLTLRGIAREMRLSRLKTDFVSNISHELRTPLTSIRLFAETLKLGRAKTPEEREACVEFIFRESERLSRLAERTLDWARIEAGRRAYERRPLHLETLVRDTLDAFLQHGTAPREAFTVTARAPLPLVDGDPEALSLVITNLLENAVKYTPDRKNISLTLSRHRNRIRLAVRDNGIGIARREQKRIFERFYRADDLLARRTEGTGLGLSIARRVVDAHGGRLTVDSRPGAGATFTVELPLALRATETR